MTTTATLAAPEAVFRDVGLMLRELPLPDGIALHVDLSNYVHADGGVAKSVVVAFHGDCEDYVAQVLASLCADGEPDDRLLGENAETRVRDWNLPLYDRAIVRNYSTPVEVKDPSADCSTRARPPDRRVRRRVPRLWPGVGVKRALAAAALAVMALLTATGCHVNAWNTPGTTASTVR